MRPPCKAPEICCPGQEFGASCDVPLDCPLPPSFTQRTTGIAKGASGFQDLPVAFVAETVNNGNGGKKGIYLQTADCGGIIEIVKEGNMLWGKKVAQAALQDSPNRDCPGTTKSVALVILIVFTDGTQTIAKVDIKK